MMNLSASRVTLKPSACRAAERTRTSPTPTPHSGLKWQLNLPNLQNSVMDGDLDQVLTSVGPRLRALRQQHDMTLADLSSATGISVSTLSRLESGQRRPTLELLLPLARAHQVPLDELVDAPPTGDPRVHLRPRTAHHGTTVVPLTRRPGGIQAFKMVDPPRTPPGDAWPT